MSDTRSAPLPTTNPLGAAPEALVLFAHGARSARWAEPLHALQEALQQQAAAQGRRCVVRLAFLELMQPDLPQVLAELADAGLHDVAIWPVFWAAGGHVLRDVPALIAQAQQRDPLLQVQIWPVLSRWPGLLDWLAGQVFATPQDTASKGSVQG